MGLCGRLPDLQLGCAGGERPAGYRHNASTQSGSAFHNNAGVGERGYLDEGGASRFFFQADWALEVAEQLAQADPVRYEAKSHGQKEMAGLAGMPTAQSLIYGEEAQGPLPQQTPRKPSMRSNNHPR